MKKVLILNFIYLLTQVALIFLGVVALSYAGVAYTGYNGLGYTGYNGLGYTGYNGLGYSAVSPYAYTAGLAGYYPGYAGYGYNTLANNYQLKLDTSLPGSAYTTSPIAHGYGVYKTL